MRYPQGHKAETRARILAAAGARFRARGYAAVGVDEVMEGAGLTAGGFYNHFTSKQDLLAAALGEAGAASRLGLLSGLEEKAGPPLLRAVAGRYLSRAHRDAPALGCPLPALASEVARAGEGPRLRLQEYLVSLERELSPRVPPAPGLTSEDRVLATAAVLVGGLLLARAVRDDALSERILRASRRLAVPELATEAEAARLAGHPPARVRESAAETRSPTRARAVHPHKPVHGERRRPVRAGPRSER